MNINLFYRLDNLTNLPADFLGSSGAFISNTLKRTVNLITLTYNIKLPIRGLSKKQRFIARPLKDVIGFLNPDIQTHKFNNPAYYRKTWHWFLDGLNAYQAVGLLTDKRSQTEIFLHKELASRLLCVALLVGVIVLHALSALQGIIATPFALLSDLFGKNFEDLNRWAVEGMAFTDIVDDVLSCALGILRPSQIIIEGYVKD